MLRVYAQTPGEALNHKQIAARLGVQAKKTRQQIIAAIAHLAETGALLPDSHTGKYRINPSHLSADIAPQHFVTGIIDLRQPGKATVAPLSSADTPEPNPIDIKPERTANALNGDTVKVLLLAKRKSQPREGQVVEVVKRARTRFVGTLQRQGRHAIVVCDNRQSHVDFTLNSRQSTGIKSGDKVVIELDHWDDTEPMPTANLVQHLGKPGENDVEMQSILAEYDFPLCFPPEVEAEAAHISAPTASDMRHRKDFRHTTTFTIDPADAKDFDDALSLQTLPDGQFEVGVHIADVSHYVVTGSAIDREAYARGTSIYLVDRTIPMLPERLCNDICSLRPNEDKLCFSVVMRLDAQAKVGKVWIGKGVIRSDARLSYEQAQQVIETQHAETEVDRAILTLHSLASQLRSKRYASGAINFESQEVKFILDENAKPVDVYIKESKEANWLIEEFMLLANRKVAEKIGRTRSPKQPPTFVYRVHDEPNPEKLNTFVQFLSKLGYTMKTSSRKALADSYNHLFSSIAGKNEEAMIDTIAIRTMSKAYYSTQNIGHYGLAFPFYTHFTSPIRRYPDLMVHRLLQHYLDGGASVDSNLYEDYCRHCSAMEKRAADAERTSVKYKQAEYLSERIGQEFDAVISGVTKWGFYAEIEGSKCEGMVPVGRLTDDYYMLDEDNYQIIGRRHGRCYKMGQTVKVVVRRVDMQQRLIDFDLVDTDKKPTSKESARRKRRR